MNRSQQDMRPNAGNGSTDAPSGYSFVVSRDGQLLFGDQGAREDWLTDNETLLDHARRLLESGRAWVRYLWVEDETAPWKHITIEAVPDGLGEQLGRISVQCLDPPFGLTLRELDVLTMLAAGQSNADIAICLDIRTRTVTTHVEHILNKMGRLSRTAAATIAVDFGLLRLPTPGGGRNLQPLTVGLIDDGHRLAGKLGIGLLDPPKVAPHRPRSPDPITIGAPLSLRGLAASDAREMMMSARLAVQEINAAGGVLGRPLALQEVECDVGNAAEVENAVRRLIESNVDAVTCGYGAGQDRIQDLLADYGAPYLHCATMETMVERVRQDPVRLGNVFQVCPSDVSYGPKFIQFLDLVEATGRWSFDSRRVTIIQPQWTGMDIGMERVEMMAARRGIKLDVITDLPTRNIDWDRVIARIHNHNPSAIFLAYYFAEENMAFLRHFLINPCNALVYTLYGPSVPAYREELGPAAEGVIWATTTGVMPGAAGEIFKRKFELMHGRAPGHSHAGLAYDRVHLLARAWRMAGNPRDFREVRRLIREMPFRGVNGMYFLDNAGQSVITPDLEAVDPSLSHPHLIFQIQQGEQVLLSPSLSPDLRFVPPPWLRRARGPRLHASAILPPGRIAK